MQAASLVPSLDEATPCHGWVEARETQLAPPLMDVKMFPLVTHATSFVPSDDEAMEVQLRLPDDDV